MSKSYFARYAFSILLFLFSIPAHSQVGSTCANPEVITTIPFSSGTKSTCAGANNYSSQMACGNYYMGGYDYVYKFTPTSILNSCITLALNNGSSRGIFVFDGCPDQPTTNCVAQSVDQGSVPASVKSLQLTVGKTYYFIISS